MADRMIADVTLTALERALDGTAAQQRAIADNLANLETPGYVARRVSFAGALRAALAAEKRGEGGALDDLLPTTTLDNATPPLPGSSNVDIEREMTDLSEASVRYEALVQMTRRKFEMLGTVIADGRRG